MLGNCLSEANVATSAAITHTANHGVVVGNRLHPTVAGALGLTVTYDQPDVTLENRQGRKTVEGSNPSLSTNLRVFHTR